MFVATMIVIAFVTLMMFMDVEVHIHPSRDYIHYDEERIEVVVLRLNPPVLCMLALVGILMTVSIW